MTDLLAARLQMAWSLGFHIVFASVGMAMPFLMAVAHGLWLRQRSVIYRDLTKAWARGVAIFFATGAVSGTALSFELGLLWPEFMKHAGPIIGMPFSWEGTAFFLEAIALGLFLYGWDRLKPWVHWLTGLFVGICGVASAYFVICANAWMNSPAGFDWLDGGPVNIDPVAAMFNARSFDLSVHMIVASFVATGFAVAGVHAFQLYKGRRPEFHGPAMRIALTFGAVAALLQPLSGDLTAKRTAATQPLKLAAAEALFETTTYAPLVIGGLPDLELGRTDYAIEIPGLLSFLAHGSFAAEVKGLNDFPRENWPPVLITHVAYQVMVGIGTLLAALGALYLFASWRRPHWLRRRSTYIITAACTPLGFVAIEAGWTVTEVGRQPWVIYGFMKTSDALSPMPGLTYTFALYGTLYALLAIVVCWLMMRQIRAVNAVVTEERR